MQKSKIFDNISENDIKALHFCFKTRVLKVKKGEWKTGEDYRPVIELSHKQFNAYVEGYDFDITNSTSYDQAYVDGRDIFSNISLKLIFFTLFNYGTHFS